MQEQQEQQEHENHELSDGSSVSCVNCRTNEEFFRDIFGPAGKEGILTLNEQEVLGRIRDLGRRARDLKTQIRLMSGQDFASPEARAKAEAELETLRQMRSKMEWERIAAAEERMRALGHA